MKKIILVSILSLLIVCKSGPEINPQSDKSSDAVIGEMVSGTDLPKYLLGEGGFIKADTVYLMKVSGKNDKLPPVEELIKSNYTRYNSIHFLNIKPGKYRIVGYTYSNIPTNTNSPLMASVDSFTVYLTPEAIKKTEFEVKEKEFKILGNYHFKAVKTVFEQGLINTTNPDFKEAFYGNQLGPDMKGSAPNLIIHSLVNLEKIENNENITKKQKNDATKYFKETPWEYLIR